MSYFDAFRRNWSVLWRMHGKPTLYLIQPISEWELDDGVEYDAHNDQFVDGDGEVVAVDWTEQPYDEVGYLPMRQRNQVELAIPGMVTTTSKERAVVLQWSSDVAGQVAAAWGVAIGAQLYRIKEWTLAPEGVDDPIEILVTLTEA